MFIGVDIGGTFTDLVVFDDESGSPPEVIKVPSNPRHPHRAVVEALTTYRNKAKRITLVSHATTIATNALLTHQGLARTALVTNEGFRDILEIARQRRPEIYNLKTSRPIPLIERRHRYAVKTTSRSSPRLPPAAAKDLQKITQQIIREKIESVAIALLNSYQNPKPEEEVRRTLTESGFTGHVDISSEIDRQYREYERTSTTVVNASLAPLMAQYLTGLRQELVRIGVQCPVYVMNSDGTASTTAQSAKRPITMIESGPAAGVISSMNLARLLHLDKVITFDMGGTTAKAGTIINGRPDLAFEFEAAGRIYHGRSVKGSGYPVRQSFIDLAEVSAGGGTIAWLDETRTLRVGPESAGADPGPAAYGKGGTRPTVTDANIVAGRINASQMLNGRLKLSHDLSVSSIRRLARRLESSLERTAENILRIVNSSMTKALSLVSVERGRDPREYALIAFGGAGPVHACDLAEELEIKRIIVPLHPGLFSAFGLLTTDLSRTFSQPILKPVRRSIEEDFAQLREQTRRALKREGFTDFTTAEQVDLRYQGQAYEITVPYRRGARLARRFGREHKKLYGYSSNDTVEAVNARIRAVIPTPKAKFAKKELRSTNHPSIVSRRRVMFQTGWQTIPIYHRERLWPGTHGKGPCIVEEYDSTIMIGRDWHWKVDQFEDIELTLR